MPTSAFTHIPLVCHLVSELQPESILDVGVGFGKWGHLFREIVEISRSSSDPQRYHRANWKGRLDGIEGFEPYVTEMHRFLYDKIHIGDMVQIMKGLPQYDVIFMGDVIEHVAKPVGLDFLREALGHAKKAVIVTTPAYEIEQHDVCGNPLEDHRSLWAASDFRAIGPAIIRTIQSKILVAALLKPGVASPRMPSRLKSYVKARLIGALGERRYRRFGGV
jgi:hypothetical protein